MPAPERWSWENAGSHRGLRCTTVAGGRGGRSWIFLSPWVTADPPSQFTRPQELARNTVKPIRVYNNSSRYYSLSLAICQWKWILRLNSIHNCWIFPLINSTKIANNSAKNPFILNKIRTVICMYIFPAFMQFSNFTFFPPNFLNNLFLTYYTIARFFFSFICLFPFYIIKYRHPWLTINTSQSDAASARYFPDGDRASQHLNKRLYVS